MNSLSPGSVVAFYNEGKLCVGVVLSLDQSHLQLLCKDKELTLPISRILISGHVLDPEPTLEEAYRVYLDRLQNKLAIYKSSHLDSQLSDDLKPWTELSWPDQNEEFLAFIYSREHPDLYAWKKNNLRLRNLEEREKLLAEQKRITEYSNWLERVKTQLQAILEARAWELDTPSRKRIISEIRDYLAQANHSGLIDIISSLKREEKLDILLQKIRLALGDLSEDTDPILAQSGLPVGFPIDLQIELSEPLLDSPPIQAFSIDEEDSSDLDDAISLEELEDGVLLGIHISDLASRINPDSELFQTAQERVSSLYLAPGVTPLLPFELSHETLSLKQGCIRPCLSISLHLDKNFLITDWHFHFSRVQITKNYTYKEVDRALKHEPFSTLHKICRSLSASREKQNPDTQEKQIAWYFKMERGRIVGKRIDFSAPSRQIVEELMVCYNSLFATRAQSLELPLLFRNVSVTGITDQRQNSKAFLSTEPDYHPGLGVSAYAHASSPIRRFTDLVNQIQMHSTITGQVPHFTRQDLDNMIPALEDKLQILRELSQASERYWFLSFLKQEHLNDPIPAVVVKQVKNTVWVDLPDWGKRIQLKTDTQVKVGDELQVVLHEVEPSKALALGYLIS